MKKTMSKSEIKEYIENFFENISEKNSSEIKKIKKLSSSFKIPLKEKRKLFCKKCLFPHKNPNIRIKNDFIRINCENCDFTSRWRIK